MSSFSQPYTSSLHPFGPPAPPPKPNVNQDVSRHGTPGGQAISPTGDTSAQLSDHQAQLRGTPPELEDPGEQWLPKILEYKMKQDLADVVARPALMAALVNSSMTSHASTTAAQESLKKALQDNVHLASHLNEVETRLTHLRSSAQTQLLATHALERQWRQKQSDMDRALAPSAPSSLYQRLAQGVQEQEMVCRALEESFLEGHGETGERDVTEWVKRYRDAKKVYYARRERKERWDEGRVGGWR